MSYNLYTYYFVSGGGVTPKIIREEIIDPCQPENHKVIQNQPNRSFNRHLSQVTSSDPSLRPICDQLLEPGWYRFDSPAGNLMPTECPGGKYCGTNMPIWMKGKLQLFFSLETALGKISIFYVLITPIDHKTIFNLVSC